MARKTWNNVVGNVPGLPKNSWVSWVQASNFDAGTAYAAFDRHTFGDLRALRFPHDRLRQDLDAAGHSAGRQRRSRLCARHQGMEDADVSKELLRAFKKRGINVVVSAKTEKVEKTKDGVAVTYTADGKQAKVEAEKVLVAVGRVPRTDNVGVEKTKIDRRIRRSERRMETAEPGIYAIGDIVAGLPQLAHVGAHERHRRRRENRRQVRPRRPPRPRSRLHLLPIRRSAASASPKRRPKKRATRSRSASSRSPATPRPPSSTATTAS